MAENKRFRVFKYPDCKEFGVSDDVTDCNYGRFNYYEAETLCEILNELNDENKELKEGVEEFNEICKYYEMRIKELSEQADAVRTELQLCEEENNELQKENEQLKKQIGNLEHTKDFCADVCADCERLEKENEQLKKELHKLKLVNEMLSMDFSNSEHELWRENEQLKQSNERLLKMLDNVANYMQRQNKDVPLDDFVEWWNTIATEGLDD